MRGAPGNGPDMKKALGPTRAIFRPDAAGASDSPATVYLFGSVVSNAPLLVLHENKEQHL